MIIIRTNNRFIAEKRYIIDIILDEFLGLNYSLLFQEGIKNYKIILENGKKLIIKDHFFSKVEDKLGYLRFKNVPDKVLFVKNQFLVEDDIPVIYGDDELVINQDNIICGIDIFASSFFMLTRWEEYVNKVRDQHNRFPASASLTYKNNFLYRPVVNEYVEMLWNMLLKLRITQKRKRRKFEMVLTHDIDVPLKYMTLTSGFREIIGDFIKRRDLALGFKNFKHKFLFHTGFKKDPFDTFDYLMNISERIGIKSYFFLMDKGTSNYDNDYKINDKFLESVIQKINIRGHNIGFHPSYNTYNDKDLFGKEKTEIETRLGIQLKYGRQHYLRFEIPTTWQIWDDNNMEWDSTLSYGDKEGFRCGTCYEYSTFNFLTHKKLTIKERPLVVMDGSFVEYQLRISPIEMEEKINILLERCRKYRGLFVFLWHNSSFGVPLWEPFENIYENIVIKKTSKDL